MKFTLFILVALQLMSTWLNAESRLSVAEFNSIIESPGDNVPLREELRKTRPFWKESQVVVTLKFPDAPSITEKMRIKLKTVRGRYAVFSMYSPSYGRDTHSIFNYDEEGGVIVAQSLYGDQIISGVLTYDSARRIYSGYSNYVQNGDFTEYSVGQYSNSEVTELTQVLRQGKLVMTREATVIPLEK